MRFTFFTAFSPVFIAFFLVSPEAYADDVYVQINGRAIHHSEQKRKLNENNAGIGVQYTWDSGPGRYNYVTGGTMINSVDDRTMYLGGGQLWRTTNKKINLDVGYLLGVITYPSSNQKLIPGILPIASIGTDDISINMVYIPRVVDNMVPALFLQLKIRISGKQ